ncbi:MAG: NTP transferase domain-containing protein [bacterium]
MQVIILAAGTGSRLGKGMPKALVNVAGKTMLEHQMEWISSFNPERIVVVSGFHHKEMVDFCKEKFSGVTVVENKRFTEQNLYSLLSAKKYLTEDTLIMNVDHIYPKYFAERISPLFKEVQKFAIFADTTRELSDDDMKVFINPEGVVEKISKKLTNWNAGYIGMTFIKKDFWKDYFLAAAAVSEAEKEKAVVEMVIQRLVDMKHFPEIIDSDNVIWYEIDTMEELKYAEEHLFC